jgi:hypothetical protein
VRERSFHSEKPSLENTMTASSVARILESAPASALPGTWKLARGRAVTLRPSTDGIVKIAHGRIWATVDGPHGLAPDEAGDHILEVGRSMFVRAGQRVVLEAWNASGASYFAWDPVCEPAVSPAVRARLNTRIVVQPLADLRLALGLGGRALGQLVAGVSRLGWQALRGGGRGLPGRRPHGAPG